MPRRWPAARPAARGRGRSGLPVAQWLARSRRPGRRRRGSWRSARIPIAIGGLARHNVANALAAAGGARGLGATIAQVARRPARLPAVGGALARPAEPVPARVAAGDRRLRPQRGRHLGRAGRRRGHRRRVAPGGPRRSRRSSAPPATGPTTRCAGIGRIAAQRAQRVAIKETRKYLRGRTRESVVGELLAGSRPAAGPSPTSRSTRARPRPCAPR